jgi:hypothetical protein
MLVEACEAPYFFYTQDDWLLDAPIHFAQDIPLLDEVDVLRYRWAGSTVDGVKMLGLQFEEISTKSGWFFAHSPYLARREAIMRLFPMSKLEQAVNSRAKDAGLRVAVRRPSIFTHIGEKSVMRDANGDLL